MKIFAHRGASAEAPENTLKAIALAIEQGADSIEIDIQQAQDEFWVFHDTHLGRTTDGEGRLHSQPLDLLRSLDAGEGQGIPTLKEAIMAVEAQCELNIELKGISDIHTLIAYLDNILMTSPSLATRWLISSFDHTLLRDIKQRRPQWRIGALTASIPLHLSAFASELNAESVHYHIDFINRDCVIDAHARGLCVYCYTADAYEDIKALYDMEVDGVFTNWPARTKAWVEEFPPRQIFRSF